MLGLDHCNVDRIVADAVEQPRSDAECQLLRFRRPRNSSMLAVAAG